MVTNKSNYFLERLGTSSCFRLLNGKNTIGRNVGSTIVINSTYCSRDHCTIEVNGNVVKICDESTNGTYLNDVQLLHKEDIIEINTKIGIGVTRVENELENDNNLYVLVLKNLLLEVNSLRSAYKQEPEIIELLDSDEDEATNCHDPPVNKKTKIEPRNVGEISNPAPDNIGDRIMPTTTTERTVAAQQLQQRRKSIQVAIGIFGSDIISDMRMDDDFRIVIDDIKIEPTSLTEYIPDEPQETNSHTNNLIDLTNDEDFIQSQHYLKEIKEEIKDFDDDNNDDGELNNVDCFDDNNELNDNCTYSPIIEISDDENDLDEQATTWMMKLSQSMITKEDPDKVKKANKDVPKSPEPCCSKSLEPFVNGNSALDKTNEIIDLPEPASNLKNDNNSASDKTDDIEMESAKQQNDKKRKLENDIKKINEKHSKKSATIFLNNVGAPAPIRRRRSTCKFESLRDMINAKQNAKSNSKPTTSKESNKIKGNRALDNSQVLRRSIRKVKSTLQTREKTQAVVRRPNKLRFDSIPKPINQKKPLEESSTSKESPKKNPKETTAKKKKTVRFNDNVTTKTYNSYETSNNLRKIGTCKDAALPEQKLAKMNEQRIILNNRNESKQTVLNEILSWKFKWLEDHDPQINGTKILRPMLHHYDSYETYKNIVYPLMKLEFWVTLEQDSRKRVKSLVFKHFEIEDINDFAQKRIIFICEEQLISNNNMKMFFEADLVAIEISVDIKIFGYIRCVRFNDSNCRRFFDIIIEANWSQRIHGMVINLFKNNEPLKITKLSEIRIELGAFEAINSIKNSPLLSTILNPHNIIRQSSINTSNIQYVGYHRLNTIQRQILLKTYLRCLNSSQPTIQLIEGPPGTGKSLVIVNLILQLIYGNESRDQRRKFLICAHSNVAVDVIAMILIRIRNKMEKRKRFTLIRFGNLDKMNSFVRQFSLQQCYQRFMQAQNGQDAVRNEEIFLRNKIEDLKKNNANGTNNNQIDKFSNELNRISNFKKRDQINILKNTQIICSTVSSCVNLRNYVSNFDVCLIDEATQCNEPWSLLPIELGIKSLILTGDTNQLPATCISTLAKDYNYGKSLFTRIKETIEDSSEIPTLLRQYRMHPEIAKFPNNHFYKNLLENDIITYNTKLLIKPYSILNLNFAQNQNNNSSISNCMEAKFVIKLIENLAKVMSTDHYSYGIITPYSKHRDNLNVKLKESNIKNLTLIEINTIDAFQGKEKDIIIISNARTEGVGFLRDPARLNVSLTRAKKCLILCGNYQQLEGVPVWKALMNDAKKRGVYYNCEPNAIDNFEKDVFSNLLNTEPNPTAQA